MDYLRCLSISEGIICRLIHVEYFNIDCNSILDFDIGTKGMTAFEYTVRQSFSNNGVYFMDLYVYFGKYQEHFTKYCDDT